MVFSLSLSPREREQRILDFLKRHAPFSVLDQGRAIARDGSVSECARSGRTVRGMIRDGDQHQTVSLEVVSSAEIEATCTCSSREQMKEQWCSHAVALLCRADELGFFHEEGGFEGQDISPRVNTVSSQEIASVISTLEQQIPSIAQSGNQSTRYEPHVRILLDFSSDRLGVQVTFDGEIQAPSLFDAFSRHSHRILDGLFLRIIDEEGIWDEQHHMWFINSSEGIGLVLGLLQEYDDVVSLSQKSPIRLSPAPVDARIRVRWTDQGAEIELFWALPDGEIRQKDSELLGTGPYWTALDNTVYKLSPSATRIASLFPHSGSVVLTKSQVAPLLEVLQSLIGSARYVDIENPELQPTGTVAEPIPTIRLERIESSPTGTPNPQLQIMGIVEFQYPKETEGTVILPHRELEKTYLEALLPPSWLPLLDS